MDLESLLIESEIATTRKVMLPRCKSNNVTKIEIDMGFFCKTALLIQGEVVQN